jgi:hypothetical protein
VPGHPPYALCNLTLFWFLENIINAHKFRLLYIIDSLRLFG